MFFFQTLKQQWGNDISSNIKSSGVQGTAGGEGSRTPYMEKAEVYASLLIGEEMWEI